MKKYTTLIMLICISFLVLFFNSYFNHGSGIAYNDEGTTLGTRFFLSGPDPYYNMRLCEQTLELGYYPYTPPLSEDPLLNYPIGDRGSRPPLFNMLAVSSTVLLGNFMDETDALGWSMLFLPAIYGMLLVFPVYGIGKELFNRKVGLISALLIPLIPIHISSGHGSSYALFDHDSFLQLLFALTFYFTIRALKEKDLKSIIFSALAGLSVASIYLSWSASKFIFILFMAYAFIQLSFDLYHYGKKKGQELPLKNGIIISTILILAFLITLPYAMLRSDLIGYHTMAMLFSIGILGAYYIAYKLDYPWIITLPSLFGVMGIGAITMFILGSGEFGTEGILYALGNTIFSGVYATKIGLTIAEGGQYSLSQIAMSFGPAIYIIGLLGFVFYLLKAFKEKFKAEQLFFIIVFIVDLYLLTNSARFINDLIPGIVIFNAFFIMMFIDKIDYKKMIYTFRNTKRIRSIKLLHIAGILFIAFLVVLPNTYLALEGATPPSIKSEVFGEGHQGVWGLSLGQSYYWSEACYWLAQQDLDIPNDADKPGIISWWDYGFYLSSMGRHPTVADNYQDGIPPASNFHTSSSEKEAVAILIIRLCDGAIEDRILSNDVKYTILEHLPEGGQEMIDILEVPERAPSNNTLIKPEYGNTESRMTSENAKYQDVSKMIVDELSDEQITEFYLAIQHTTGTCIRYYGIDQYDTHIFNIFSFLSDKSLLGYSTFEDDYFTMMFIDSATGAIVTPEELPNLSQEIRERITQQRVPKPAYYNTTWYRSYYGGETQEDRYPTYGMKHFVPVYLSPYVVIAKYYEGAKVTGTVTYDGLINNTYVGVFDEKIGLPHHIVPVDITGYFEIICPAGNLTFQLLQGQNVTQSVNLFITEEEATRRVECNKELILEVKDES